MGLEDQGDPEHVHGARTSIRRLRAVLRAAAPFLAGSIDPIREELGWLGSLLGTVRDVDVMSQRLSTVEGGIGTFSGSALDGVRLRIEAERAVAAAGLRAARQTPRYSHVCSILSSFTLMADVPDGDPLAVSVQPISFSKEGKRPAARSLPPLVRTEYHRLEARVARARKPAAPKALHAIRIQAKRCRYTAELAVEVCGTPASAFVETMTAVQDVLGAHHDAVVLGAWLRAVTGVDATEIAALRLLVSKVSAEEEDLASEWRALWKRVRAKRPDAWTIVSR